MTTVDAHNIISAAAATWSPADLRRLAYVVALGPPSALADGTAGVAIAAEHDTDPGDVRAMRPVLDARARAAAALLHVYREVGALAGVPLPVPGATRKEVG